MVAVIYQLALRVQLNERHFANICRLVPQSPRLDSPVVADDERVPRLELPVVTIGDSLLQMLFAPMAPSSFEDGSVFAKGLEGSAGAAESHSDSGAGSGSRLMVSADGKH